MGKVKSTCNSLQWCSTKKKVVGAGGKGSFLCGSTTWTLRRLSGGISNSVNVSEQETPLCKPHFFSYTGLRKTDNTVDGDEDREMVWVASRTLST